MLTLRPATDSSPRERILVIGASGAGKSYGAATIAEACPDRTVHVIDNDAAWGRMAEHLSNVQIWEAQSWSEHVDALKAINKTMGREDWLVVDMLSACWDLVQDHYTEQVFGESVEDYFLQIRKQLEQQKQNNKNLGAFDGWIDWQVINKLYRRLQLDLLKTPGHQYAIAGVQKLGDEDRKNRDITATFGPYNLRPTGQKKTAHNFHTVILCTKTRTEQYQLTTIKDRNRTELTEEPITNFAKTYLRQIAGWKPRKQQG